MDFMLYMGFVAAFGLLGALVYYVMEVGRELKEISANLSKIVKFLERTKGTKKMKVDG